MGQSWARGHCNENGHLQNEWRESPASRDGDHRVGLVIRDVPYEWDIQSKIDAPGPQLPITPITPPTSPRPTLLPPVARVPPDPGTAFVAAVPASTSSPIAAAAPAAGAVAAVAAASAEGSSLYTTSSCAKTTPAPKSSPPSPP